MRPITLSVLCEGRTEFNFVTQVLTPHLRRRQVHTRTISLDGVLGFESLRRRIKSDVGRSRAHEYVTTMLDLYALPAKYPGDSREANRPGIDRARAIEAAMAEGLPNPRSIPYIQVHEFEALVFVDLDLLPKAFPDGEADAALARLKRSVAGLAPEDIDDGAATAPSKRLIRAIPAYEKRKELAGPLIAAKIGLPRIRQACPHFGEWVGKLETLGQPAPAHVGSTTHGR